MEFQAMVRRPETPEQRIDRQLHEFPARPFREMSIEELRNIVDQRREEMLAIYGNNRKVKGVLR